MHSDWRLLLYVDVYCVFDGQYLNNTGCQYYNYTTLIIPPQMGAPLYTVKYRKRVVEASISRHDNISFIYSTVSRRHYPEDRSREINTRRGKISVCQQSERVRVTQTSRQAKQHLLLPVLHRHRVRLNNTYFFQCYTDIVSG